MSEIKTIADIHRTINNVIRSADELAFIQVTADILQLKEWNTMAFLELADKSGTISGVIRSFKNNIAIGDSIEIIGHIESYKNKIQINISHYEKSGKSKSDMEIEKIIKELTAGGFLSNKKLINTNIKNIGIISSKNAAGLKDFLHIVNQRTGYSIYLYEATVQGTSASKEIEKAIDIANRHAVCDILCIIRGGGSKDDLGCFNDVKLAKAITKSKIPTLSGIGHEIDTTIVDMVVDRAFITPSAVAQFIVGYGSSLDNLIIMFKQFKQRLSSAMNNIHNKIYDYSKILNNLSTDIIKNLTTISNNTDQEYRMIKIQLVDMLQKYRSHILNSKTQLSDLSVKILDRLDQILISQKKSIDIDSVLNSYSNKLSAISQPKIYNEHYQRITSKEEYELANSICIEFIDGIVKYKNK